MKEIFISHTREEATLAIALKTWLQEAFAGKCLVFVSSTATDLPGGKRWMETLFDNLAIADVVIVLCSPQALLKRWISFEAGGAWSRKVPLIPICHSGVSRESLPSPFSSFQAINLNSATFVAELYASLELHLGCSRVQDIDDQVITARLKEALRQVRIHDLFISMPMTSYAGEGEYADSREILVAVRDALESCHPEQKIYSAALKIESIEEVDLEQDSAEKDLNGLRLSKHFLLIYPNKLVTSCLVEAGYALALGIPSTYLVRHKEDLPFMLREAAQVHRVRTFVYKDTKDLMRMITKSHDWIYQ